MSDPFGDFWVPSLIEAIESNLLAWFRSYGPFLPGAVVEDTPDLFRFATSIAHPLMNGVLATQRPSAGIESLIEETIAFFRMRKSPTVWWTGPSTRPVDLEDRLARRGFHRLEDLPGMAADLTALPASPAPGGFEMRECLTAADLREWMLPFEEGFEAPRVVVTPYIAGIEKAGIGPGHALRLALGTYRGMPAACTMLCISGGVAGLYCVATTPEVRGKGLASALTRYSLEIARQAGCRTAVLHATRKGEGVYARLGFVEYCRVRNFALY